jgi:hypothetical protein
MRSEVGGKAGDDDGGWRGRAPVYNTTISALSITYLA